MNLTFIGSGDAFGTGGRFNTCFRVEHAAGAFLIDCGASSMVALRQADVSPNAIDTIFITHLHGDHFGGLPFFLMDAMFISGRTAPLTLAGPPGLAERLERLTDVMFPGISKRRRDFELTIREIEPGPPVAVGAVEAKALVMAHESGSLSLGLRLTAGGRTLAYTGDTGWTDELVELAAGVDLLVSDCTYFTRVNDAHLAYAVIRRNRARLACRRLILTHFGPEMFANRHLAEEELAEDRMTVEV